MIIYSADLEFVDEGYGGNVFVGNQQNPTDLTIHGYSSSTEEAYAAKYGYTSGFL